jgi:hypothetical protein
VKVAVADRCCITQVLSRKMDLSWARGSGPFLGGATLTSKEPEQSRTAQERHTRAGGLTAFMSTTSTSSDIRPAAAGRGSRAQPPTARSHPAFDRPGTRQAFLGSATPTRNAPLPCTG